MLAWGLHLRILSLENVTETCFRNVEAVPQAMWWLVPSEAARNLLLSIRSEDVHDCNIWALEFLYLAERSVSLASHTAVLLNLFVLQT